MSVTSQSSSESHQTWFSLESGDVAAPVASADSNIAAAEARAMELEQAAIISGQRPVQVDVHPLCGQRLIRPAGVLPPPCPRCGEDLEWRHQDWPPLDELCRRCFTDSLLPDISADETTAGNASTPGTSSADPVPTETPQLIAQNIGAN